MSVARLSHFGTRGSIFGLAAVIVALVAHSGGRAQVGDALPFTTGHLLTGDYVVGSANLIPGNNELATGTIQISGVPKAADILAAFLYWETVAPEGVDPRDIADHVTFRGEPIKKARVKTTSLALPAQCFTSQGPNSTTLFRADVLRLLPPQLDVEGKSIGKLLVNDADLLKNGLPLHQFTLPTGGLVGDSAGASLVVIYRDPAEPLRKVVLYDGLYLSTPGTTATQTIGGFYQAGGSKQAKLTHIAAASRGNGTETLFFNDVRIKANPFQGQASVTDRGWEHVTFDVTKYMNRSTQSADYGETVTSTITSGSNSSNDDCLTYVATLFSVPVLDADGDGLPDRLEQPGGPLKDPNNVVLPDLHGAGARLKRRDFFAEVNAMRTLSATTYGSADAPYDSGVGPDGTSGTGDDKPFVESVVAPPHNHMPVAEVLKRVGDAMRGAPISNADGTTGIWAHFDVGNVAAYHALGGDYLASVGSNDEYLVPTAHAKGGELTDETACAESEPNCQFPDFPGVVGWGFSLNQFMLDKFDRNRDGLFHYLLYSHFRGRPRAWCVNADGTPDEACRAVNKDFHVPWSSSGVADLPGFRAVISMGRWDNFVGTPFGVASTTLHEVGHNWELYHGGHRPQYIDLPISEGDLYKVMVLREPNCKPNDLSVMSYLFQMFGLIDSNKQPQVDLSRAAFASLDEPTLSESPLVASGQRYRTAWYAPIGGNNNNPAAQKFCGGGAFPSPLPENWVAMARVDAPEVGGPVDWNMDGITQDLLAQDVNFDGTLSAGLTPLLGHDDWSNIRLNQISGGHLMGDVSAGGQDFGGQDFGGQDFGGQDFGGQDFGGQDFGGQDFGGQDFGGRDFDGQDFGGQDFGGQDFGGDGELTREEVEGLVGASVSVPNAVSACVIGGNLPTARAGVGTPACDDSSGPLHRTRVTWDPPTFGTPTAYLVMRTTGASASGQNQTVIDSWVTPQEAMCTATGQQCSFVDPEVLPDGVQFTYVVKATADEEEPPPGGAPETGPGSDPATITARNDAPIAAADALTVNEDSTLVGSVIVPNPTAADTDPDGPALTAMLESGPANGVLQLASNGTFAYTPAANYFGSDSFTYRLLGGVWGAAQTPISPDSAIVTVRISVNPVNDQPSFVSGPHQVVDEDSGLHSVPNWATGFTAGPSNETNGLCVPKVATVCEQTVLAYHVSQVSGPAGLFQDGPAIDTSGTLTYTPAPDAFGSATFSVMVQDTGGTAFGGSDTSVAYEFLITVNPLPDSLLTIVTLTLPNATDGVPYSQNIFATGGTEPYTWGVEAGFDLPLWLTLSPTTGVLSGTPPMGTSASQPICSFRVRVTDADGNEDSVDLCLKIDESTSGPLVVTTASSTTQNTLNQIAGLLAGSGVTISNVTYKGARASLGTFAGGFPASGLSSGVILSSGGVRNIQGPNSSDNITLETRTAGDADLNALLGSGTVCAWGSKTCDAAVLEFDFTVAPGSDQNTVVRFEYVFASEEFNEYANSNYNDVFGFFLSGPGMLKQNIALIPGTSTPVSINTVNGGHPFGTNPSHPELFVNNDPNDGGTEPLLSLTQADGLTKVLTVQATVIPGQTYRLKLAIADVGDRRYDSWVLVKARSLTMECPPPTN